MRRDGWHGPPTREGHCPDGVPIRPILARLAVPRVGVISAGGNIDPGLTPTSPGLSAPRGGEGRYGGATDLLSAPGGVPVALRLSSPPPGALRRRYGSPLRPRGRYGGATNLLSAPGGGEAG